jgi:DinB superfamily
MPPYVSRLRGLVERNTPRLLALSVETATARTAPDTWSPCEIIGHLIDSASNNHQRFVRIQFQDSLVFPGYDQNQWVTVQRYRDAPWAELVGLWRGFNLHLARVMEAIPDDIRTRIRARHNLHELAWREVPANDPTTLDYFMDDYVNHLRHHLRQILRDDFAEG